MLIKIFTALSLLAGIGAAIGSSLWPLAFIGGFVGCFLGLIVLGFVIQKSFCKNIVYIKTIKMQVNFICLMQILEVKMRY